MPEVSSRFVVERELGRGGMGVVLLARDLEHGGRQVALKRLGAAVGAHLLEREFESARRLRHPVIVSVLESGRDAEGPFLVMEFVDGDDLGALAGKVGAERVAGWALQLADALEYARRRGYVHGDLKPQNLRVPRADPESIRILDLGLARLAGGAGSGGTPAYLAPEVLAGRPADARADLFSLGCVLHECLTGKPAFTGIDRREGPALLPDSVPAALRDVVSRLLRRRPEDRPGRAADLVLLLGKTAPLRLPLPEGDLVGRESLLARVERGRILLIEAGEGLGATRLLAEVEERAALAGHAAITHDVGGAGALADPETLRREAAGGAAVVAAFSPGQTPSMDDAEVVKLARLDDAEVLALVESRMPLEPQAARAVARWALCESGGSPALVVEALEALRDSDLLHPGPLGLECDEEDLSRLEPAPSPRLRRAVAGLAPAARESSARDAIRGHPGGEAMRRALVATLDEATRRQLHGEAAEALLAEASREPRAIARHLLAAARDAQAASWLVPAAEAARAVGARREAKRWLALAVERLPAGSARAHARLELGSEQAIAGEHEAALASQRAARAEDPGLAAASFLAEAELHASRKESSLARLAAVEVIRLARKERGEADQARALFVLGRITAQRGRYDVARRHFASALVLHRGVGETAAVARVANALANVEYLAKRYDEAIAAYERALDATRDARDRRLEGMVLHNLARIYVEQRRSEPRARAAIEASVASAEQDGDFQRLARALLLLALYDMDGGRLDDARRVLERATSIQLKAGDRVGAGYNLVRLGEILTLLGRFEDARRVLNDALEAGRDHGERRMEAYALDQLARLALDMSDPELALSYLERNRSLIEVEAEPATEASLRASFALAFAAVGRAGDATQVLESTPEGAEQDPEIGGRIARARAAVLFLRGNLLESLEQLTVSAGRLRERGLHVELARTLLQLAPLLNSIGSQSEAVEALEEARHTLDGRGAKPLLARTLVARAKLRVGPGT